MDLHNLQQYASYALLLAVPVLFSVTIHEIAHGAAAVYFGDPTPKTSGRLTFNPIKHIDPIGLILLAITMSAGWAKPVPCTPSLMRRPRMGTLVTAFAGPVANLLLAVVFAAIHHIIEPMVTGTPWASFDMIMMVSLKVNAGLAIFNLLPIPPLDGSHIVRMLLPVNWRPMWAKIEPFGITILVVLVITKSLNKVLLPTVQFITERLI